VEEGCSQGQYTRVLLGGQHVRRAARAVRPPSERLQRIRARRIVVRRTYVSAPSVRNAVDHQLSAAINRPGCVHEGPVPTVRVALLSEAQNSPRQSPNAAYRQQRQPRDRAIQ
jgi:hypothetical protein